MISHIVACSENNIIGINGKIPWYLPNDLKRFKALTKGGTVIMGRKTHESIGHMLPDRLNIVITRNKDYQSKGVTTISDIAKAIEVGGKINGDNIFIIGGEEIYKQSIGMVDSIYLTRVHRIVKGDTSYLDIPDNFKEVKCKKYKKYSYFKYERIKNEQEDNYK